MPIPKMPSKSVPLTAKERVYSELKEWIVDGTLKEREKLSDREIANYFSVSRTPVREALQLLSEQKLVSIYPGRESLVAPADRANNAHIYAIMAELPVLAVRFAYPNITDEIIGELENSNCRFSKALQAGNLDKMREHDLAFHKIIIQAAGNVFLTDFIETINTHIDRIEHLFFSNKSHYRINSADEHQTIIAALKHGNPTEAENTMRVNWLNTIEALKPKENR